MQRLLGILVVGLSLPVVYSQTCPAVNFLQGNQVTVFDHTYAAGLQRQTDGSLTRQRYYARNPYGKVDSVANYQSSLLSCTAVANRTFKTVSGWTAMADQPLAPSQPMVLSNLLGDGNVYGLAVVPGGYTSSGGPSVDSLAVIAINPDGSGKSKTFYTVPAKPVGLLVADLNRDGKKDVVVISKGSGSDSGAVAVLLGNGDGTFQAAVRYTAHTNPAAAVVYDFNGDHNLDLAVVNSGSGDISVLLGKGDGTFGTAVQYTAASGASAIALGDFNGDGKIDLVAGASQKLSMLAGNGDGTFRTATAISLSITPTALAAGDFDKDGKLDLAATDSTGGTVSILLGDGQGKFGTEYDYIAGYEPGGIYAMDLDGDGNLDVVVATGHPDVLVPNTYSDAIMVFFGRGDGTLIGPPTYATGAKIASIVMADFNGDGKPDIAAAANTDLWILLSSGGGSFRTPIRIPLPSATTGSATAAAIAAGDFNGDGKQDLAIGYGYSDGVYVLLGNGDGSFQTPVRYSVGGNNTSIAVADFNGDGKLDIAVCGDGLSGASTANAGILLGNGNGTFQAVKSLPNFGKEPYSIAVADFNKDGKLDLAIANKGTPGDDSDPGGVLVFLGKGDGTFQNPTSYPAGTNPNYVAAADVNGDKAPDLLVATRAANFTYNIAVLLGTGTGTFGAATMFSTTYGPAWIAVADLNGDGYPDLTIAHCCGDTDTTFKLGNGDGTFQSDIHLAASVSPKAVLVTDLNGDGKPDLVIGLGVYATSNVAIFLNVATTSSALANVNGASFLAGTLAPDAFATAQGTGLATVTQSATVPYPTSLGGTSVAVRDSSGTQQLASLVYVSPTQINYIVPHGMASGQATVTVTSGDGTTSSGTVPIGAIGPGIFLFGGTNLVAANVLRVHADYSQSVGDVYTISGGAIVPAPIDLGPATDQVYLVLYATGLRGHSSAANSVTVTAGGVSLVVAYAGQQPTYPGLDQIDVLLPQSLAGKGDVTIQVTVDGQAANAGHVTIK